nr:hypothetical protein [Mycoplasmopsis agalactiae]
MRNKYSYKDISGWFLSKESMTPKKLQKLTIMLKLELMLCLMMVY